MPNYVDNDALSKEITAYKTALAKNPDARLPNSIGRALLAIADGVTRMPMFVNYSYRDEMAADGVLICTRYLTNFDPEKGKPFSYFSRIVFRACQRRIKLEKRQAQAQNLTTYMYLVTDCSEDQRSEINPIVNDMLNQLYERIAAYED